MMFRVLIYICVVLSIAMITDLISAAELGCANGGNITQSDFKLDLGCMDPLGEGQKIEGESGIAVLETLLTSVAELFLFTIPIIAAVSFLAAGYFYIFSAGDSEKVSKAKTIIKWNIIAIIVAFLSYAIISFIAAVFTITP